MLQDYTLTRHAVSRPSIWQIIALSAAMFLVIVALSVANGGHTVITPPDAAITQIEDWHGNVKRSQ